MMNSRILHPACPEVQATSQAKEAATQEVAATEEEGLPDNQVSHQALPDQEQRKQAAHLKNPVPENAALVNNN